MRHIQGLHHITAIAGDAQENLDFYNSVLGMRLVKKSVNQDDPTTYHLFYADGEGHPGTDLTFFPWAHMEKARPGIGLTSEVQLAVPAGSLDYWGGAADQVRGGRQRVCNAFWRPRANVARPARPGLSARRDKRRAGFHALARGSRSRRQADFRLARG